MPYKTPEEVIAAFNGILKKIEPKLPTMFSQSPKTPFEIRRTEKFREASASAEYKLVLQMMEADQEFLHTNSRCYSI